MVGDEAALASTPQIELTTLEPCQVLLVSQQDFRDWTDTLPSVSRAYRMELLRRLERRDRCAAALSRLDVQGRLAFVFLDLAERCGKLQPDGSIALPPLLTQEDVAELARASPCLVNRKLALSSPNSKFGRGPRRELLLKDTNELRQIVRRQLQPRTPSRPRVPPQRPLKRHRPSGWA